MALPDIDATVAGATANSYVTQAQAQAYFDMKFDASAWNAASADAPGGDQCKALLLAARHLSRLRYIGDRFDPVQTLDFPRYAPLQGVDPNQIFNVAVGIPQNVQDAQCEEALWILLQQGEIGYTSAENRQILQAQGVKSMQNGAIQETFADGAISTDGAVICVKARRLLKGWIEMIGRGPGYLSNSIVVNRVGYGYENDR